MPPASEERLFFDSTLWPSQMGLALPNENWETVLQKAMSLRIDDRYQDMATFWKELTESGDDCPMLECICGDHMGERFPIYEETLIGRDPEKCQISLPLNAPGVSRTHLRVWPEDGALYAMDLKSTCGTWLKGKRMLPGLCYKLSHGDQISFGNKQLFQIIDTTE
jgi:hypothetical protein